jgi:hypothetical protein
MYDEFAADYPHSDTGTIEAFYIPMIDTMNKICTARINPYRIIVTGDPDRDERRFRMMWVLNRA